MREEERYRTWFEGRIRNPKRPEERYLIVVDSTKHPKECVDSVLEQLSTGSKGADTAAVEEKQDCLVLAFL